MKMKKKQSTGGALPAKEALNDPALPQPNERRLLFSVLREATKPESKAAIDLMFKVEIQQVALIAKGTPKRFGHVRHRVLKPAMTSKRIASEDLDAAVRNVASS